MLAVAAIVVFFVWKILALVDDYLVDIPIARRLGTAMAAVLAFVAVVSPPAFAAGTNRYVDEEAKQITEWFTNSLKDVFSSSDLTPQPPPPASTVP